MRAFPSWSAALLMGIGLLLGGSRLGAATFVVTNTLDTGVGSLRWAITNGNATAGTNFIEFSIPGTNV